jgi:hypothetical protein
MAAPTVDLGVKTRITRPSSDLSRWQFCAVDKESL